MVLRDPLNWSVRRKVFFLTQRAESLRVLRRSFSVARSREGPMKAATRWSLHKEAA